MSSKTLKKKLMPRERRQLEPGLVAFYNIRPRSDGLSFQTQSAHGALKYRRNAHKVTGR